MREQCCVGPFCQVHRPIACEILVDPLCNEREERRPSLGRRSQARYGGYRRRRACRCRLFPARNALGCAECTSCSRHRSIRRHTALEQPFEIVVRYPHHPFAGKRIIVVRCRTYAHQSHFVIDAPDNYRILLPAWMTEPCAATLPLLEVPRLSIDALRALSRLIDAHRSSSSSATSRIDGGDHEPTSPVVPTRSACAGRGQTSNKTNQSSIENRSRKPSQASRQRVRRSRSGRKGRKQ